MTRTLGSTVTLEGIEGGHLTYDGETVVLSRRNKEMRIPVRSITAISIEKLGFGVMGIRFSAAGNATANAYTGSFIQPRDAQVFKFKPKHLPEFQALAAQIETAGAAPSGVAGQIAALAQLHDQGVLTDAEFTAAKGRLLS